MRGPPSNPRDHARRTAAVAWVLLMLGAGTAAAEPLIEGKLDVKHEGTVMQGELHFDLAGGPVKGQADLTVASSPRSPPKRAGGEPAPGWFRVKIDLDGTYSGGSFGTLKGTAKVTGTYTDESKCEAKLHGTGTFQGGLSGPVGGAELRCVWEEVEFEGCTLAPRQPFSTKLHFTFEPTNVVPKLRELPAARKAASDQEPAPSADTPWWVFAAVSIPLVVGLVGAGILAKKMLERRS